MGSMNNINRHVKTQFRLAKYLQLASHTKHLLWNTIIVYKINLPSLMKTKLPSIQCVRSKICVL